MSQRKSWHLSRRQTLRGLGATLALPLMEAMIPLSTTFAQKANAGARGADGQPVRFAGFFMPNGFDISRVTPKAKTLADLPPVLTPLEGIEDYMNVVTSLRYPIGGHAAGTCAFLTGTNPKKLPTRMPLASSTRASTKSSPSLSATLLSSPLLSSEPTPRGAVSP